MAKKPTIDPETHALMLAEVQRQQRIYGERRQQITAELAALYTVRSKTGDRGERPMDGPEAAMQERTQAIRERAKVLLNGFAPESFNVAPSPSRETQLLLERDALDLVLATLARSEIPIRAGAALEWVQQHGDQWRALAREIAISVLRVGALERRAEALGKEIPDVVHGLCLVEFIGFGRTLVMGSGPPDDPLRDLRRAALDQGVITYTDIERIEND